MDREVGDKTIGDKGQLRVWFSNNLYFLSILLIIINFKGQAFYEGLRRNFSDGKLKREKKTSQVNPSFSWQNLSYLLFWLATPTNFQNWNSNIIFFPLSILSMLYIRTWERGGNWIVDVLRWLGENKKWVGVSKSPEFDILMKLTAGTQQTKREFFRETYFLVLPRYFYPPFPFENI